VPQVADASVSHLKLEKSFATVAAKVHQHVAVLCGEYALRCRDTAAMSAGEHVHQRLATDVLASVVHHGAIVPAK
jgi:hypothetical protein